MKPVVSYRSIASTIAVILLTFFLGCSSDDPDEVVPPAIKAPTIESFTPTSGAVGTVVTIKGTNFDVDLANNVLKFNQTTATVTAATTTTITAIVPQGASTGLLTITVNARSGKSSANFTVTSEPVVTSVSRSTVHIGDTIVILGDNLDKVLSSEILFDNMSPELTLTHHPDKIVAIVPVVHHEHIQLKIKGNSMPMHVVGIFPIVGIPSLGEPFRIQSFSDNTFLYCSYSGVSKTVDGGYNWTRLNSPASRIYSAFFLDENHGWVSVSDDLHPRLYYTSDGGTTYTIKHADEEFSGIINQILFSDVNHGYVTTSTGDVYHSDNNDATLVYDNPSVIDNINVVSLSLVDGTVIALWNENDTPLIIKGENNVFTRKELSTEYVTSVQVSNQGRMYMVGQYSSYTSTDKGDSWTKIGNAKVFKTFFLNETEGIAAIPESFQQFNYSHTYKTTDSGLSWRRYYKVDMYGNPTTFEVFDKAGLFAGHDGRLFRYVHE